MPASDDTFYAELPTFGEFVEVAEPSRYVAAPRSWLVVITDVRGSTRAIEAGRYKDVNALGVASIVALRNAVSGLPIPYVFGGDGATLLAPGSRRADIETALRGIIATAREAFDLDIRAGIVPVAELVDAGHEVRVARFRASGDVELAMLSGAGISVAERWVKDPERGARYGVAAVGPANADFRGFECRWRPIPSRRGLVISLIVQATGDDRAETYRRVIQRIEDILAEAAPGRPVAPETLTLQRPGDAFDQEARVRSGRQRGISYWIFATVAKVSAAVGTFLMRRGKSAFGFPGQTYRDEVTANTDFRKFDEALRMVLDVTEAQRATIVAELDEERAAGALVFGVHAAPTSIMTCAIGDYRGDHVHFVDGSDGGYALAAKELKRQLAERAKP